MSSPAGLFFLSYLLAASFTDEVQFSASPVERLVSYEYSINFTSLIPGMRYDGNITALWAVPDQALFGLEGKSVLVKITATAQNNSSAFFPTVFNPEARTIESHLRCDVVAGSCANSSILSVQIPISIIGESGRSNSPITLQSEVVQSTIVGDEIQKSAGGFFDFLKDILKLNSTSANNGTNNSSSHEQNQSFLEESNKSDAGNFLDHLKPEGDSRDPIKFLKQNPVVSIIALAIVVMITGAYLIKVKD